MRASSYVCVDGWMYETIRMTIRTLHAAAAAAQTFSVSVVLDACDARTYMDVCVYVFVLLTL